MFSRIPTFTEIGLEGLKKLQRSHVTIVGVGSLGCVVASLLTQSGIGKLTLIDRDIIEEENLSTQYLYTKKDVGKVKVFVAKEKLQKINSHIKISTHFLDLHYKNIHDLVQGTIILDCTDNLETRYLLNDYCKKNNMSWIYGAVVGSRGMTYTITPKKPCFACIINEGISTENCDTHGVLLGICFFIGSIQTTECIKILLEKKARETLLFVDLWGSKFLEIRVKKRKGCEPCHHIFNYLEGKKANKIIKLCGTDTYQILFRKTIDLGLLAKKIKSIERKNKYIVKLKDVTFFKERAFVKAKNEREAKKKLNQYLGL